jgi:membrane protein DedA with SNARE-associated domain
MERTGPNGMDFLLSIKDWVLAFAQEHAALVVFICFFLGFVESVAVLAWAFPSSAILIALGAVQYVNGGSIAHLWIAAAAGAFLGDILSYAAGRYFKTNIAGIWPFSAKPRWLAMSRLFFSKWGTLGIIGSKFSGPLRSMVPVAAGASAMRWPVFVPASAISCVIWAGAFLVPGYGFAGVAT